MLTAKEAKKRSRMKRYYFLIVIFSILSYVTTHITGTNQYKQSLDRQKKFFLYASSGLFSGYGTIKYLTFLSLIKDFSFLKPEKGSYFSIVSKVFAEKIAKTFPQTQSISKTIAALFTVFPKLNHVSLSTIGRAYFGKKALFGVGGFIFSVQKLQKLKKEVD
jgi:hypothetical protein